MFLVDRKDHKGAFYSKKPLDSSPTSSPARRLKGLLPAGTVVAHETGSSRTVNGLTVATNESELSSCRMAVIWRSRSLGQTPLADRAAREAVIAEVARAAWEFWNVREGGQLRTPERND
ncbi:MAG TPA: hypothetical protein VFS12_07055 [Terriglobia bacterium]|nr:hypothetical protein [Terriglobia bacterium]